MVSRKKESILNLARNAEERVFLARCIDHINTVTQKEISVLTDFLDPGQRGLLEDVSRSFGILELMAWGGYPEAERCRVLITAVHDAGFEPDFQIQVLQVVPLSKEAELNHRDYLGALVGLGINRDVIGDISPLKKGGMAVFVTREMAWFLVQNLNRVGRYSVSVEVSELNKVLLKPRQSEKRVVTVAGLRLDALVSRAFNLSRSESASLVRQGRVYHNWRQQLNSSADVSAGDIISCRGYGKFRLLEDTGPTKRGRSRVILEFPT